MATHSKFGGAGRRRFTLCGCALALALTGCPYLNPSFLNLVAPDSSYVSIPNAPGFVVLALVNNATVDEQLVSYLGPMITPPLTDAEESALRPRMRMRLRITYTDGTFQTVEMIDGSGKFVEPSYDAESQADLNQNDLTNVVAKCDVASIALEPNSNIEVFIPVSLVGYELVQVSVGNDVTSEYEQRTVTPPQFRALQVDDVDADGNTVLRRNIDVRDVLSETTNIVCGSVVAVVVDGVLSVPFLTAVPNNDDPSYDQDDEETEAGIGGRFEFRVSVQ